MIGKRTMGLFLLISFIFTAGCRAGAEPGIAADFPRESPEAGLAQEVAAKTGLPLFFSEGGETGEAADRMLEDPACVLCGSQQALIEELQKNATSAYLLQAMTPVCRLAVSPLYLVMDRITAEGYGISDLETLQQYIAENEYGLTFARHLKADPVDRAVTQLSNDTEVFTDFFRAEEIPEALRSGEADAAVFSGRELASSGEDWLVLCCMGTERSQAYPEVPCAAEAGWTPCDGEWFGLFMSAEAPEEEIERIAAAALEIGAEKLPAGYELRPLAGEACREAVQELIRDYKNYMTAEGLFFYEE